MSELDDKALYTVRVFSEKQYKGKSQWLIQKTVITYIVYGEPKNITEKVLQPKIDDVTEIKIKSGYHSYDLEDAYLIAKALEITENP